MRLEFMETKEKSILGYEKKICHAVTPPLADKTRAAVAEIHAQNQGKWFDRHLANWQKQFAVEFENKRKLKQRQQDQGKAQPDHRRPPTQPRRY
jgi:hypothetical protein